MKINFKKITTIFVMVLFFTTSQGAEAVNVTEANLLDINDGVKGKDNATLSKLQGNINKIFNVLKYINQGNTNTSYYKILGITTVNPNNASAVKTAILAAKKEKKNNLTKSEIKQVVEDALKVKVVRARSILMEEPKIKKTVNENKVNEEKVKEVTNSKVDDINKKENYKNVWWAFDSNPNVHGVLGSICPTAVTDVDAVVDIVIELYETYKHFNKPFIMECQGVEECHRAIMKLRDRGIPTHI